jgi:hypothetical protein
MTKQSSNNDCPFGGSSCHKVGFDVVGTRCTNAKFVKTYGTTHPHWTAVEDDSMMQGQSRYPS